MNFQVPYIRSRLGFDTYDLELDLVVEPDWTWRWKDRAGYEEGIAKGGITDDWQRSVDAAAPSEISKVEAHQYPFDLTWRYWRPDSAWTPPALPAVWRSV